MLFAVQNMKKSTHTICRTNGQKLVIRPNMFVVFDVDDENENEINYWKNISVDVLNRCGIRLITDESDIRKIDSSCICNGNNSFEESVSIVDGSVSPMVKDIASITYQSDETEKVEEPDKPECNGDSYTEESLMQMSKEDLFNICENFGIHYKKNNSVKTLVALILGSDKI